MRRDYHIELGRVSAELRGLRTAIDLILTVSNYGGEVTPNNRRMIERHISLNVTF